MQNVDVSCSEFRWTD